MSYFKLISENFVHLFLIKNLDRLDKRYIYLTYQYNKYSLI